MGAGRATAAGLALMLALAGPATAMTVELHGDTVFAKGAVGNDLAAFERALAAPGVTRVAFVDSPGGDLWTALRVGALIAGRGLRTVVAGSCVSACAIMFLGGRERRFSDALPATLTWVGLHGAHRSDTRAVDPVLQPQIYAWFKQRMADRFDAEVVNRALYDMADAGALLRVHDAVRPPRRAPLHCRSAQTPRRECTEFAAHDAVSLGVVTDAALVALELPAAFRPSTLVFGQALPEPAADPDGLLAAAAARACRSDDCRRRLLDDTARREHWAVAIGTGEVGGWGRADGSDTLQQAALGALQRCNHRSDGTAVLCGLESVDGRPAAGLHTRAVAAHEAALAVLMREPLPAERLHANEQFGGGLARLDEALRTQRLADITPLELPKVRTVVTGDLAARLRAGPQPVLVDVGNGAESLPGAQALWNGGLAFDEAAAEQAYDRRFRSLLELLAPERGATVVFYCASRQCWQSVNAARRAERAGWQQVLWYRGGVEAWRAAGLPLAPALVRAVVH